MSDLNSKIEKTKAEVSALNKRIDEELKEKKDTTLGGYAKTNGVSSATVRAPPATKCRRTLKGHFGKVTAIHWAGDSKSIVSASQDGNLLIWNALTANKIQSIALKSSYVMAVGIEQSRANLVACGGLDNLCTIYKRTAPEKAMEMASHDGFLSCCRFINESEIITSSGDSTCIKWDINAAKPVVTFAEHKADALFLSLKPKDPNVFISCSVDQTCKLWDTRIAKQAQQTFRGPEGDVNCVQFMPSDGNCFACCSQDDTVRVFDIRAYNELNKFGTVSPLTSSEGLSDGFTSLDFSSSGRLVFVGHSDGSVLCYDILSDRNQTAFTITPAHDRHVSSVGVSPQGNALCTAGWDGLVKIWA